MEVVQFAIRKERSAAVQERNIACSRKFGTTLAGLQNRRIYAAWEEYPVGSMSRNLHLK